MKNIKVQKPTFTPHHQMEIHKGCCKRCPSKFNSVNGIKDPEVEDMKKAPPDKIVEYGVFPCFCREDKLCKGICDEMNVDLSFLKTYGTIAQIKP